MTHTREGNAPAFPLPVEMISTPSKWGLTKREYFAAMAMQGLCASGGDDACEEVSAYSIAQASRILADALLSALNEETE